MGRRDSNDKEWQAVKERVRFRDKEDRILKILTGPEYLILKRNAGIQLQILDPAHYLAVSERPDLCYKSYNIVLLNRYSHENLDRFKNPINGDPITKEEVKEWWIRILKGNKVQYDYLLNKNLI